MTDSINAGFSRKQVHEQVHIWLTVAICLSLPFFIKIGSICIILLMINWGVEGGLKGKIKRGLRDPFTTLWMALFTVHLISAIGSSNQVTAAFEVEKKLGMLVIPLVIRSSKHTNWKLLSNIIYWLPRALILGLGICSILKIPDFIQTEDSSHFFYHSLLSPFNGHAVYYSFYMLTALWLLVGESAQKSKRQNYLSTGIMTALLVIGVLVLASKLAIILLIVSAPFLVDRLFRLNTSRLPKLLIGLALTGFFIGALTLNTPIKERFIQAFKNNAEVLSADSFAYDTPFNGFSLRLIQLRLGLEILEKDYNWIRGVGIGDAQEVLNEQYASYGIYLGNPELGDDGYSNSNFHNQFIQTWVQSGILALFLLLLLSFKYAHCFHSRACYHYLGVFFLWFFFFCTESVLETHKGLIFILLIASVLVKLSQNEMRPE